MSVASLKGGDIVSVRFVVWLLVNLALVATCLFYSTETHSFDAAGATRVVCGVAIALLGLLSVFIFPWRSRKTTFFLLLTVSLFPRLALLPTAPSDDVNRYLWEGKLTAIGVNPYQDSADAPVFEPYQDEYWELMNHRDRPTAYPPLAMQVFRVINVLNYHPMSYKVVAMLLDMLLIATLLALLRHHCLPQRWVLFYALSPLSLFSYAAEGHFDILMVLALALAMLAHSKRWWATCGAAVAVAVGVKIMAAVVAPILLWRSGKRGWSTAAVVLILPLVFYWEDLGAIGQALFIFGSGGSFNSPIHGLLSKVSTGANLMVVVLYGLFWLFAFWLMLKQRIWSSLLVALGALVVLSPIIHFWYLTWILPMVVIRPKFSWISLSVTCSLYFLVWHSVEIGHYWGLPLWAKWAFWVPFFVLLLMENKNILTRLKFIARKSDEPNNSDFSIVIPTYNPGENLQKCIHSIAAQKIQPREIILADASSSDGSLEKLNPENQTISQTTTELGRGQQIKAGVEMAQGEWVVIVHSDVILTENTLQHLSDVLHRNPNVVGGAMGQRFSSSSAGLLLIEAMNEFRAVLMQTSFGDQTQFFHRETTVNEGVLTDQPLMEDVEMSDRIGAFGDVLYLGEEGEVSARKWIRGDFWKRFFTVIEFCLHYRLLAYSREKRSELSRRFYDRYYRT